MWTMTARVARERASWSSASVRSRSPVMMPWMVTREICGVIAPAIELPVPRWISANPITAAMAISTATARQKLSLRRMRRRSTILSVSSDIRQSPELVCRGVPPRLIRAGCVQPESLLARSPLICSCSGSCASNDDQETAAIVASQGKESLPQGFRLWHGHTGTQPPPARLSYPRPTNGICVAITVMNSTLAESGRFAM